jgi:Uma2 family endonuclease
MATQHDVIIYPEEDGKLTESEEHYAQGADLFKALRLYFADRPDVFVGGNIAFYYEEGNPRKYFGPDVLVAFGVRPRTGKRKGRPSYFLWEEGVSPTVIFELASEATWRQDLMKKPRQYARLGVQEYYLFDPLDAYLKPRLQGHYLSADGTYERRTGDELDSPALGLRLVIHGDQLRCWDPATGEFLPTLEEAEAARRQERAARRQAEAARAAAEAEAARLRAELARLRGEE